MRTSKPDHQNPGNSLFQQHPAGDGEPAFGDTAAPKAPSEQPSSAEFIFGNQQLHSRLFVAIELLAQIVISTPRPVGTAALADAVGRPVRMVRAALQSLSKSGLVAQDESGRDAWYCAGTLGAITLADIFRSISAAPLESGTLRKRKNDITLEPCVRSSTQQSVDLLLMQATMAVNQVVLQHLQQFDLGRLRAVAAGAPFRMFAPRPRAYRPEPS